MEAYEKISIYPMDQTPKMRKRILSLLEDMGIRYTYEAY